MTPDDLNEVRDGIRRHNERADRLSGKAAAEYRRRCSFDQVALDMARFCHAVCNDTQEPNKQQSITKMQIAITDLLMRYAR